MTTVPSDNPTTGMQPPTVVRTYRYASKGVRALQFRGHPEPVIAYATESLAVVAASDAAVDRYKFSRRQFLRLNLRDLHAAADHARLAQTLSTPDTMISNHGVWRQQDRLGGQFDSLLISRDLDVTLQPSRLLLIHPAPLSEEPQGSSRAQEDSAVRELDLLRRGVRIVGHTLRQTQRQARALYLDNFATSARSQNTQLAQVVRNVAKSWRACDPLAKLARASAPGMQRQLIDLSRLASDLLRQRVASEPQRRIEIAVAPELRVAADAGLIGDALSLLIDHAVRSTRCREAAVIQFGSASLENKRVFFLRDNGVGFYSAVDDSNEQTPNREQVELDLTAAELIIARHGGRMWMDCATGIGTTCYFTL